MARTGGGAFTAIGRGLRQMSAREEAEAREREREAQRQKERQEDLDRDQRRWEAGTLMTPGVRRAPDTETRGVLRSPDFAATAPPPPDPFAPGKGIGLQMPTDLPTLDVPDSLKPGAPINVTVPYELEPGEERLAPGLAYDTQWQEKQIGRERDRVLEELRGVYGDTPEGERRARAAAAGVQGRLDAPLTGADELAELEDRLKLQLRYSPRQLGPRVGSNPEAARAARELLTAVGKLGDQALPEEIDFLVQNSPFASIEEARAVARSATGLPDLPDLPPPEPALGVEEDEPNLLSRLWKAISWSGEPGPAGTRGGAEPDMSNPAVQRAAFLRGMGHSDEEILEDAQRRERMGIR